MSTFINLTNELLRRLNEVQIDESSFAAAKNVQALAKDAINSAIRQTLQDAQEWPFLLVTHEQTLTAGTGVYSFPADYSKADWDTFFIKRLTSKNNIPKKLKLLTYDQYLTKYRSNEEVSGEGGRSDPEYVYTTQDTKFGVTPVPDAAYVVEYRYFKFPADLVLHSDVSIVPDRFKHVILDGAMMYMMIFRSNEQSSNMQSVKFEDGIKMMRRLVLDQHINVISTMLQRSTSSAIVDRI